ncbi:MAG: AAA family ATPase [Acidobacteria bacterium]|nr:AAA family ATPase [Acidobacteriota bacterium]
MRITDISIQNYKSFRSVKVSPKQVSILVGANASGKTNFADCLDFVSEVYRLGLEVAVARKGGYENIAFRKMRRSKRSVNIELCIELSVNDIKGTFRRNRELIRPLQITHSFKFVARGYSIRAEFEVVQEKFIVSTLVEDKWVPTFELRRKGQKPEVVLLPSVKSLDNDNALEQFMTKVLDINLIKEVVSAIPVSNTELLVFVARFFPIFKVYVQATESIRVFQISPYKSREFGVPTPKPELDRYGGNLPAVVDLMQKKHKSEWKSVMEVMRNILPSLRTIDIDYTSSRTLGLYFNEEGIGRPWSVAEVSDGTIQTLALLVALFSPNSSVLVIEEPENSIHPWIIRHVLEACRDASTHKQIFITTHSPIVINAVKPEEVWVLWRCDGESHITNLLQLDPEFMNMWAQGEIPTFEYIDSGALPAAIPPIPLENFELAVEE